MPTRTVEKYQFKAIINMGTHDGKIKTASQNIGGSWGINSQRYEISKAYALISPLGACLARPILEAREIQTATVTE